MKTNHLIIGSGVAGLTLAIKLAEVFPQERISIVTKAAPMDSNTNYAQGGIAAVMDATRDSFEKHITDTLVCGDGLCDAEVVKMVVTEGPACLKRLMDRGAQFDFDQSGNLALAKEGGHTENRVIHHKDQTGKEIQRTLLAYANSLPNIEILSHHFVIDLITYRSPHSNEKICSGALIMNRKNGEVFTCGADTITLTTGGAGRIYGQTTNPKIATGDGIAMAYRAGAMICDMAFIQFHPTAFYDIEEASVFLISEAVRGFGAYLRDASGKRFMFKYDHRGELASRDIVSRAIAFEAAQTGEDHVYLDCTHLDQQEMALHFPFIVKTCLENGIHPAKDWIPVAPAAHYFCGGIAVNMDGKTSIGHLFACGECSHTGLHGANRLASNSLLEALVYADRIFHYIKSHREEFTSEETVSMPVTPLLPAFTDEVYVQEQLSKLNTLMLRRAGVIRNTQDLLESRETLVTMISEVNDLVQTHQHHLALKELQNMLMVSQLVIDHSLEQTENRGGFYSEDFVEARGNEKGE